jgi:Ca2+/Na+ antiporter
MEELFIDPSTLSGPLSGVHLVFLTGCYIALLITGSKFIASGGELLLLVPSLRSIVGGIILPILGAVPDGAMILFSGLGKNADKEVAVGVGALSGSTVMLLTIPVFLACLGGSRPSPTSPGFFLKRVEPLRYVAKTSLSILVTAIFYVTLQICAFALKLEEKSTEGFTKKVRIVAGVHAALCFVGFGLYLVYQLFSSQTQEDAEAKADALVVNEIHSAKISFRTAVYELGLTDPTTGAAPTYVLESVQNTSLIPAEAKANQRIQRILKPFFVLFDTDKSGALDFSEIQLALLSLHETLPKARLVQLFEEADVDNNGSINFDEFCGMVMKWTANPDPAPPVEANENDEEDEIPEDLADLPPEIQQKKIKIRAFIQLAGGLILVFLFSDPACGCFNEIGARTHIPAFFISFVLAPLVSNGSELLSAYVFAAKKTPETISISLSTLIGAAAMNNTFCLGILLLCIAMKELPWDYLSQVIGTLLVEIGCVCIIMWQRTVTMWHAVACVALYPISIGLIYGIGLATGHWSKI